MARGSTSPAGHNYSIGIKDLPVGLGVGKVASGEAVLAQQTFLADEVVAIEPIAVWVIGAGVFDAVVRAVQMFVPDGATADYSLEHSVRIQVFDDQDLQTPSATALLSQTPAGVGTVVSGTGTNDMLVQTDPSVSAPGGFSLRVTDPSATPFDRYVAIFFEVPGRYNSGVVFSSGQISVLVVPP